MASQKRSISFDESVLNEAERRLAESGGGLSAFVNGAVLRELRVARGLELLAKDDADCPCRGVVGRRQRRTRGTSAQGMLDRGIGRTTGASCGPPAQSNRAQSTRASLSA
jgi:hypothetical protein